MSWGVIYYNSKFLSNLESLIEQGVMFPSKLYYFKSHKIDITQVMKFLTNRAE